MEEVIGLAVRRAGADESVRGFDSPAGTHRQAIIRRWPEAAGRTLVVRPDGGDIEDPIGGPAEVYSQCAAQIEEALSQRVETMEFR